MATKNWARIHFGATVQTTPPRSKRDLYITPETAVRQLCGLEKFSDDVWECACGTGAVSHILRENGYNVRCSDLEPVCDGAETMDFFTAQPDSWDGDIVTNPPYTCCLDFVKHAIDTVTIGHKVVMFLPLTFLETVKRVEFFRVCPMARVYVATRRLGCANYSAQQEEQCTKAIAFCWFVWEKGWHGEPVIRWFN